MTRINESRKFWITLVTLCLLFINPVDAFAASNEGSSDSKKQACLQWCSENPYCDKCTPSRFCSTGMSKLKTYIGSDQTWIACGNRDRWIAVRHRLEAKCNTWCRNNDQCRKCVPISPCPDGVKTLRSFKDHKFIFSACGPPVTVKPLQRQGTGIQLKPGSEKFQLGN